MVTQGSTAVTNFQNSIVATNGTTNCSTSSGGTHTSLDYNIDSGSTCGFSETNDQSSTDPLLGPLALHGGRSETHALLDGSPALDAIPNSTSGCGSTYTDDQRGATRPGASGGDCDTGAYERGGGELIAQSDSSGWGGSHDFNSDASGINVGMTVDSGSPGIVTVLKRPAFPGGTQDAGEFEIIWTLHATGSSYQVDVTFCYTEAELTASGGNEADIRAYRWDAAAFAWVDEGGTVDAGNNCIDVADVTALSPWTIAANAPTAVTLVDLRAEPSVSGGLALPALGLILAALALAGAGLRAGLFSRRGRRH